MIAIIAILAAILFPVFAQAREKARQTACLSNMKQMGTSMMMYIQDYDETYPLAFSNVGNRWLTNFWHMVPADWSSDTGHPAVIGSPVQWANALQPYIKNYGVYACPSGSSFRVPLSRFTYDKPLKPWQQMSYTYNGLLNSYSQAGIESVSQLPLVWEGRGKVRAEGGSLPNPILTCSDGNQPCIYQPRGANGCASGNGGTGGAFGIDGTIWIHSNGVNFVFADGSAKWRKLGSVTNGRTDFRVDPYTNYNASGVPSNVWTNGCHPWLFRPDYNFQ